MLLNINSDNPNPHKIKQVVECLRDGGTVIYPTDTIYGIGCSIQEAKAIEKVCQLKGIKPNKANLSFICADLSNISDYTLPFDKTVYKLMRKNLPGPFTFILKANNSVPKLLKSNKKTVGIRVPDHSIARAIVEALGHPLLSTSLKIDDEITPYPTDPEEIYEMYGKVVDIVIDGGVGGNDPSTVVDVIGDEPEVIRESVFTLIP